jgi:hypothetical protein
MNAPRASGAREPWFKGYQVKMVDGNAIAASEHWLGVL